MKLLPIVPFEPICTEKIPSGEHWISQIKWDGVRMLLYYDGYDVNLFNRRLNNRTMQYPELAKIHEYCSAQSVILDGEIIALKEGKPSFHQVMKRDSIRKQSSVQIVQKNVCITYMIFDILYLNGNWIIDQSLDKRQNILGKVITPNDLVQLVSNHADPKILYKAVVDHGLEGIIIKDLTSKYAIGGKDKRWQKKKVFRDLFAVAGGVTYRNGIVNALLLGLYDDEGQLWYIGHVGTGKLTQQDWRDLSRMVEDLKIPEIPFANTPSRNKEVIWIKPQLVMKVNFLEWTPHQSLRQPTIQSFVNIDVRQCTFSQT